jgi:hypothetical protein
VAKFRAPRGTTVSDFVKHHFRGGVNGVDMDLVVRGNSGYYEQLWSEQEELAKLRKQAIEQSHCACVYASRDAKLKNLRPAIS